MSSDILTINEDYKEKAIAVFGNSKPYLNEIKNIGGLFNARLKYKDGVAAGWIFPKTKLSTVKQLVEKINSGQIKPQEEENKVTQEKKTYYKKEEESREKNNSNGGVTLSRDEFMYIMNTLTRLEQEINLLKKQSSNNRPDTAKSIKIQKKNESEEENESEDDEEENESEDDEEEKLSYVVKSKGPSLLRRK